MKQVTCLAVALSINFVWTAYAGEIEDIDADIVAVQEQLLTVWANPYEDGSVLWALDDMHRSVLELNLVALQNYKLVLEGKADTKTVLPVVEPDPERAAEILADIRAQMDTLAEAEAEAADARGLFGALAQTRVLTEKLSLAQLRMAYFQAAYGAAPAFSSSFASVRASSSSSVMLAIVTAARSRPTACISARCLATTG